MSLVPRRGVRQILQSAAASKQRRNVDEIFPPAAPEMTERFGSELRRSHMVKRGKELIH